MPIQNNHLMKYVENVLVYSVDHDQAAPFEEAGHQDYKTFLFFFFEISAAHKI